MKNTMRSLRICLLTALLLALFGLPFATRDARAAQAAIDGPTEIDGSYQRTEPVYVASGAEPRVYLVDLASEVTHDPDLEVSEAGIIQANVDGTVSQGTYRLQLPILPKGPQFSLDKSDPGKQGIQIDVVTLTDSFDANDVVSHITLPQSNGTTRWDIPNRRVSGGKLFVWSPDTGEKFPTGSGADKTLFTADDPLAEIPQGWSMIDLDASPFQVVRSGTLEADVIESVAALEDYSQLDYQTAWSKLFTRVSTHYPFTDLKKIDWQALHDKIQPMIDAATDDDSFIQAIQTFAVSIPDTHVEVDPLPSPSQTALAGETGMGDLVLTDDGLIVVGYVDPGSPADKAGMKAGAVISQVDRVPVLQALDAVSTVFSGASTPWYKHSLQLGFFLRGAAGSTVNITFQNVKGDAQTVTMTLRDSQNVANYSSAFGRSADQLVVVATLLQNNIGYIKIYDFYEQRPLEYRLFVHYLQTFIDQGVRGIIIDDRDNGGGFSAMGDAMAGHFTQTKTFTSRSESVNDKGQFTVTGSDYIYPQQPYFNGRVAVLIDAQSVSEADFFAYDMKLFNKVILVGNSPTAGAGGAIQEYKLPGDYHFQAPEYSSVDASGNIIIEGMGVAPTIRVPVTVDSARSSDDPVVSAALSALLKGTR